MLTKAQKEALDFVKDNEVYFVKGKFVSPSPVLAKRRWTSTFKALLSKGMLYKASLNSNKSRIRTL